MVYIATKIEVFFSSNKKDDKFVKKLNISSNESKIRSEYIKTRI